MKILKRLGPIHTTGYTLRGLMPASVYEVAIVSRNRFGWSDSSKIMRFATSGESKFTVMLFIAFFSQFLFTVLVELPNYSTESSEDEELQKEDEIQNYYDDSSSSGMIPQPTDELDLYDPNSIEDYYSKGSRNTNRFIITFVLFCLFVFH